MGWYEMVWNARDGMRLMDKVGRYICEKVTTRGAIASKNTGYSNTCTQVIDI